MGDALILIHGFHVHANLDVDKPIYRCIKLGHLLDLHNRHFYFHSVIKWDDTWEIPSRYFQPSNASYDSTQLQMTNLNSSYLYGTCWTDSIDSDALWRIYSGDNKDGVCIKTTLRKLFSSIDIDPYNSQFLDGFVGPVIYKKDFIANNELSIFSEETNYYPRYMVPAFLKRYAFEHEHEIRFLVFAPFFNRVASGNGIYLPLKDTNFIDELILDPRLSDKDYNSFKRKLSLFNCSITKSQLYSVPDDIYDATLSSVNQSITHIKDSQRWNGSDFVHRELKD